MIIILSYIAPKRVSKCLSAVSVTNDNKGQLPERQDLSVFQINKTKPELWRARNIKRNKWRKARE